MFKIAKNDTNVFGVGCSGEIFVHKPMRCIAPTSVPIVQKSEWAAERVWTHSVEEYTFSFARSQILVPQSVVSLHTDSATPSSCFTFIQDH